MNPISKPFEAYISGAQQGRRWLKSAAVLVTMLASFATSCSGVTADDDSAEGSTLASEEVGTDTSQGASEENTTVDVEGVELIPQFRDYQLSYSATCGDGPAFTGGTEIKVLDGVVTVTGGEEPRMIGSLELWNELAVAASNDGRKVEVELTDDGSLSQMLIEGRGIDDEFCVDVVSFESAP
jgi:hypothetical protein